MICCDGCEKAYHAECIKVDADTLPDVWYGPCCVKRTSPRKKAATTLGEKDAKTTESKKGESDGGLVHEQSEPSVVVGGATVATKDAAVTSPAKEQAVDSAKLTSEHPGCVSQRCSSWPNHNCA